LQRGHWFSLEQQILAESSVLAESEAVEWLKKRVEEKRTNASEISFKRSEIRLQTSDLFQHYKADC